MINYKLEPNQNLYDSVSPQAVGGGGGLFSQGFVDVEGGGGGEGEDIIFEVLSENMGHPGPIRIVIIKNVPNY